MKDLEITSVDISVNADGSFYILKSQKWDTTMIHLYGSSITNSGLMRIDGDSNPVYIVGDGSLHITDGIQITLSL